MAIEHIGIRDAAGDEQDVAVDVVGTDKFQAVKIVLGADGAMDALVDSGQQTSANSVPVVLPSDAADVKVTLDGEAVVLGVGSAAIGKLAANSGVDIGDVDVTSLPALPAGTALIGKVGIDQTTPGTTNKVSIGTDGTVIANGGVAHDSADSGAPVKVGAKAISAAPTAVAANDRTDLYADLYGQLRVTDVPINLWSANHDETGAVTDHELVAAPSAGLSLYLTDIVITSEDAAATVKLIVDTASAKTALLGTLRVPAGGGIVVNLRTPIKLTAAKNLGMTTTGTTDLSVFVSGYTAP